MSGGGWRTWAAVGAGLVVGNTLIGATPWIKVLWVNGRSMEPTMNHGEFILFSSHSGYYEPSKNDLVLFR
jgi:signal peptidase I